MRKKTVPIDIPASSRIAFVMSPRLGDAIIAMLIVFHLQRAGHEVVVYSQFLKSLSHWFPSVTIKDYPQQEHARLEWQSFDCLLYTYRHDILYAAEQWHRQVVVFGDYELYNKTINMVDLQLLVCKELLSIAHPVCDNGLRVVDDCCFRQHQNRVVIHPTASMQTKYWRGRRFVILARKLKSSGFHPVFITTESERKHTAWIEEYKLERVYFSSLDRVAHFIAQSGWFIGCCSGLGHLASSIGIPTVSLHQRPKVRRRWHPAFAANEALLPMINLVYKPWKEHYWKYFLTSGQVMRAFVKLQDRFLSEERRDRVV